jgi:transketolase
MSVADILAVLYFHTMNVDPKNTKWEDRDRFILSAGHKCSALYATLALRGFFPIKELNTFEKYKSRLAGHVTMHTPGVDFATGSLGHGLPVGGGMALGIKLNNQHARVFVVMGDGELNEGTVWEAAMAASQFKLDNLVGIIDRNMLCMDGQTEEIMSLEPLAQKWTSFGWEVAEIDGNNIKELVNTFDKIHFIKDKPSLIIARTIKGKGISFMENKVEWHSGKLTKEQVETCCIELNTIENKCNRERSGV